MNEINDLTASMKTRTLVVLGSTFKEAPYGIDLLKNNFKNSKRIFSVIPQGVLDTDTVTRSVTYDQDFKIQISDSYINKAANDSIQQQTTIDLMQQAIDVYRDLVDEKCGLPGVCLNVTDLDIDDPIQDIESKIVIIDMEFTVKYRILI